MVTATLPRLTTFGIDALGPFDLDVAARFLAGFMPAARPDAAEERCGWRSRSSTAGSTRAP